MAILIQAWPYSALASGGTWKDHAALKIMPSPWPRMMSAPENCFDFEIGRRATPYSPGSSGEVVLRAERSAGSLEVTVSDDGRGLPADFSLARAERLGLQIVRTLVGSELRGSLDLQRGQPRGTVAVLSLPLTVRR